VLARRYVTTASSSFDAVGKPPLALALSVEAATPAPAPAPGDADGPGAASEADSSTALGTSASTMSSGAATAVAPLTPTATLAVPAAESGADVTADTPSSAASAAAPALHTETDADPDADDADAKGDADAEGEADAEESVLSVPAELVFECVKAKLLGRSTARVVIVSPADRALTVTKDPAVLAAVAAGPGAIPAAVRQHGRRDSRSCLFRPGSGRLSGYLEESELEYSVSRIAPGVPAVGSSGTGAGAGAPSVSVSRVGPPTAAASTTAAGGVRAAPSAAAGTEGGLSYDDGHEWSSNSHLHAPHGGLHPRAHTPSAGAGAGAGGSGSSREPSVSRLSAAPRSSLFRSPTGPNTGAGAGMSEAAIAVATGGALSATAAPALSLVLRRAAIASADVSRSGKHKGRAVTLKYYKQAPGGANAGPGAAAETDAKEDARAARRLLRLQTEIKLVFASADVCQHFYSMLRVYVLAAPAPAAAAALGPSAAGAAADAAGTDVPASAGAAAGAAQPLGASSSAAWASAHRAHAGTLGASINRGNAASAPPLRLPAGLTTSTHTSPASAGGPGGAGFRPHPLAASAAHKRAVGALPSGAVDLVAARMHQCWVVGRVVAGWRRGPRTDAAARRHALLVPPDDLPDEDWRGCVELAHASIAAVFALGCSVVPAAAASAAAGRLLLRGGALALLSDCLAENAHEVWAEGKVRSGWRWGVARDDTARLHPLLVSYVDLAPVDQEENRRVADACLTAIADAGLVVVVAPDASGSAIAAAAVADAAATSGYPHQPHQHPQDPRRSPAPWLGSHRPAAGLGGVFF
jgi:hypothetical protein